MKVDFWQLSRDPAERVVAMIAERVIGSGERLLVVAETPDQREAIAKSLWETSPEAFLANGKAEDAHADVQPILLSDQCSTPNGASHVIFADGKWRDKAGDFERSFLLFGEATLENARECWRSLDQTENLERSFFRQDGGKWVKVA